MQKIKSIYDTLSHSLPSKIKHMKTSSVPVRRTQDIKSIYDTLSQLYSRKNEHFHNYRNNARGLTRTVPLVRHKRLKVYDLSSVSLKRTLRSRTTACILTSNPKWRFGLFILKRTLESVACSIATILPVVQQ